MDQNREATGDEPLDERSSPSHSLELQEQQAKLQQALDQLTEEHRSIIVLRHLDEMSYEDIAEVLDISVGTVRSRLHRARVQLLEHLRQILPDEAVT